MKYERFEDLPVWKLAQDIAVKVYILTRDRFFHQTGDLCGQLRRSSLSISNNTADGFERGTTAELLAFLYIARGSAGEVRSMLHFVERFEEASHLKPQISELKTLTENCSRQIRGWADSLQNSDIKGQRHLNEATRHHYQSQQRAAAFEQQLQEIMHKARPQDYANEQEDT